MPNPGPAWIEVLVLEADADEIRNDSWIPLSQPDLLLAGTPMPDLAQSSGTRGTVISDRVEVEVVRREFQRKENTGSLFGVQWEPWFCHGMRSWRTAHAVPLMGFYESYNRDVIRQHILWFIDLGVDFIFPDWTNHLWGKQNWDERSEGVNAIVHATTLTLEVLAEMRAEGLPVPQVVLFPGLSNGPPATMQALNEELDWIYHTYLRNPRFEGLWLDYLGKPLVAVLDTCAIGDKRARTAPSFKIPFFKQTLARNEVELDAFRQEQPPVKDDHFTVRWMSSQNDTTGHHELGYWSWMDGIAEPPVTFSQGKAEAVTVCIGFFGAQGWKGEGGKGRRGGATLVETFQQALKYHPKFVFLHQFNEFAGQPEGHGYGPKKDIFVDSYSVELSDDFEPVSMTAPGYRGDQGGWGFYYLNLVNALMDLYRQKPVNSTVLAVSHPLRNERVNARMLKVEWAWAGVQPGGFKVSIDRTPYVELADETTFDLNLDGLEPGEHLLSVEAVGAETVYPLSWDKFDRLEYHLQPLPVRVDVPFCIERT